MATELVKHWVKMERELKAHNDMSKILREQRNNASTQLIQFMEKENRNNIAVCRSII